MVCISHSAVSSSLRQHGLWLARLLSQQDFPGKNTGEGCHSLLQGIFLTQGSKLGLLNCRQILYHNIFIEKNLNKKASTEYKSSIEVKIQLLIYFFKCSEVQGHEMNSKYLTH